MIILGMDIGSTTSKCVILKDGAEILAWAGADMILIPSYFWVMNSARKEIE